MTHLATDKENALKVEPDAKNPGISTTIPKLTPHPVNTRWPSIFSRNIFDLRLCDDCLLAASLLAVNSAILDGRSSDFFFFLLIILVVFTLVSASWNPETGFAIIERCVLAGKVDTFSVALDVIAAALRECASAGGEFGRDRRVRCNPVGESILAVLDDGFRCLVSIICGSSLARSDWGVIDEFQKMLSVTSNYGELLAVLAESIKLVGVGSLQLLAGDVGELGFSDEGLGLSTDKLLLEDDNLGGVWFLVLELSDLVRDLLLALLRY